MLQIIRILSLIGLWLSGLSLYEYLTVKAGIQGLSVCKIGQNFDCGAVSQSSWSIFLGLPLASWGIAYYISVFLFGLLALRPKLLAKETYSSIFVVLSFGASLFSVFLFCISYFSIGKLCPLCIGMYFVNFIMFFVSVKNARPLGLFESFSLGTSRLIRVPLYLLGIKSSAVDTALVRAGTLVVCLVIFGTTVVEDYIGFRMIEPQVQQNTTIKKWLAQPQETIDVKNVGVMNGDFSIGNWDAPIQVVEFSDFQCPACRRMYNSLKPLIDSYKDNINFVAKNFPLDDYCNSAITQKFHEHSCYAANVARCAGEQGKFWEMASYLNSMTSYDRESDSSAVRQDIDKGATALGLDETALKQCVQSERQLAKVKEDVAEGIRLKVNATPAIWINGKRFEPEDLRDFKAAFDSILAK